MLRLLLSVLLVIPLSVSAQELFPGQEKIGAQLAGQVLAGSVAPGINLSRADLSGADLSGCLLYTSPSPRDRQKSRMPSSA